MALKIVVLAPIFAVILPIVAGFGVLYFYLAGVIGATTALLGAFTLAAVLVTGVALHGEANESHEGGDLTRS